MKKCSACNQTKPFDQFQRRAASKDGLTAACAECLRKRDAQRYKKEAPLRLARQRNYMKTPEGIAAHARATEAWRIKNKVRHAAQVLLNNAVRDGRVVPWPACAEPACKTKKVEGHHPDYDRPLDVVWLCKKHHGEVHQMFTKLLREKA